MCSYQLAPIDEDILKNRTNFAISPITKYQEFLARFDRAISKRHRAISITVLKQYRIFRNLKKKECILLSPYSGGQNLI